MRIELNDKEVAMLIGLLGITSGNGLADVYSKLMMHASIENPDIKDIAALITEELFEMLRYSNINEDIVYKDAIRQWNEQEGLI